MSTIALGAVQATAVAAPSIDTDYGCYTPGMGQHVTGTGFTPAGPVELTFQILEPPGGFRGSFTTTADATGAIDEGMRTPPFRAGTAGAIIAIDKTLQSQGRLPEEFSASITVHLSPWELVIKRWDGRTARAKPGRRSELVTFGWVGSASATLYAHYLRAKRLIKTARVGGLTGRCLDLTTRMREFPFKPVERGAYRVVFDTTRAYPNDDSWIRFGRVVVGRADAIPARAAWARAGGLRTWPNLAAYGGGG